MLHVIGVPDIPCHTIDDIAASVLVAMVISTTTGGKLPLGLGGQAELFARQLIQPADELLAVVPGDTFNRQLYTTRLIARIGAHNGLPELLGHLGLADLVSREGYLVLRHLVIGGVGVAVACAHHERASINGDHLESDTIDFKLFLAGRRFGLGDDNGQRPYRARGQIGHGEYRGAHLQACHSELVAVERPGDVSRAARDGVAATTINQVDGVLTAHIDADNALREAKTVVRPEVHRQSQARIAVA